MEESEEKAETDLRDGETPAFDPQVEGDTGEDLVDGGEA